MIRCDRTKVKETLKIFNEKHADFLKLNLPEAINWEKYNLMSVSHHSTAIEGSTLTEIESQLLLDEGTTPKGKPYEHSAMEKDHYDALQFVVKNAKEKKKINPEYLRAVSAKVMHGTGKQFNVASGNFDSLKGEYRTIGVFAGKTTFPNYMKVEGMVKDLCEKVNEKIDKVSTLEEIYTLAFDFHFDLVSIHPFADGNGRVSRLMMNHILIYHDQTPAIVHKQSKVEYISSIEETRSMESMDPMRKFLFAELTREFERVIEQDRSKDKGRFFTLI